MAIVRLKKGFDIHLLGSIQGDEIAFSSPARSVAVVPDDFHGIIPRMEKKEGEHVIAGEPYVYSFGSVIWKKTTVSICIVTLSFVITG